ncbi:Uncharacterized protein TCM_043967 [Theobroma cacao]|uniref:Uncharacterized protein n=1 Tax=Theobroma cacao TaxID=3641 RepID=A0A061FQ63_THECC|nr:Uncharacterized protein TCM_043967 [Theobroma cacao]
MWMLPSFRFTYKKVLVQVGIEIFFLSRYILLTEWHANLGLTNQLRLALLQLSVFILVFLHFSCDEFDDKSVNVDEAEIEGVLAPFDDFIDLDVLFSNHIKSSTMNQIILTPQVIQDEAIPNTEVVPNIEVILTVEVIPDVGVDELFLMLSSIMSKQLQILRLFMMLELLLMMLELLRLILVILPP